ncbi:hypothetical protein ACIBCN_42710 [Nocardia sp. NPDC051052]|uniref:hypothetical protein n=1 Tax=Nocardia sp. NPDC051052 TaxID=3364322 RepID=UPI00379934E0
MYQHLGQHASREQIAGSAVYSVSRHGINEIVATYGVDAVRERITQLRTRGDHVAADCIARELGSLP